MNAHAGRGLCPPPVHSAYSLKYGTGKIEDLVSKAVGLGYSSLALTDINNVYGVHRFIAVCREHGVRSIIGIEIRHSEKRAVLLCKDREGFSNLCMLTSKMLQSDGFDLVQCLWAFRAGLVILSDDADILDSLCKGKASQGDVYAMITPFSKAAARFAGRRGIPVAAAGDVSFLEKDDFSVHRVLRAIDLKTTLSRLDESSCAPAGAVLFSKSRAGEVFSDFPDALKNTGAIARKCRFDTIFEGFVFPACPVRMLRFPGQRTEERLRELTLGGAEIRYGEVSDAVLERIDYELGIISEKKFTDYFLAVRDIVVRTSRTCGRGSGAASIVAYGLFITNVDPIRHNLYFERFLNPGRKDPPDMDIDFAWDERDGIIDSVIKDYGDDFAARVCNHNHFKFRGAVREVARVFGIPDPETTAFEKTLPGEWTGWGSPKIRSESAAGSPQYDPVWEEICGLASRIEGLPSIISMHSGGLVITRDPVSSHVPVMKAGSGAPLITWEKDGTEEAGLVKIDLLGNRSLAVIRDAVENIRENGAELDTERWKPEEDEAAIALLARGDSMGVFYVESPAMRQLQKKTGRGDFEHIVIHSSIIRPAANRYINEYVERLKGKVWEPLHPHLEKILDETYGIMVYQEDVSKAAIALAGFSAPDADGLRKIMSKKNKGAKLKQYRKAFFEGAEKNGVDEKTIESVWNMILSFDGYSFCKPHSASYAMVSFQSAWLKAHYPAEFMAAVISNRGGYYTASAYISEAKRMGLEVLHPCVNESRYRYTGSGGKVRVGFMEIRGLRKETAERIVEEREKNGRFKSIADFQGG